MLSSFTSVVGGSLRLVLWPFLVATAVSAGCTEQNTLEAELAAPPQGQALEEKYVGTPPPDTVLLEESAEDSSVAKAINSGLGNAIYSTTARVEEGKFWGVQLTNPRAGYAYTAVVKPLNNSGNPDAVAYGFNGSAYRNVRQSRFISTTTADEAHLFVTDLQSGERMVFMAYGTTAADFSFFLYERLDVPLRAPVKNYTWRTVPITAIMDLAPNDKTFIQLFTGTKAYRIDGCKRANYADCTSSDVPSYTNPLGYRLSNGKTVAAELSINYLDGGHPQFVYYDSHTGTDICPPPCSGVAVVAPYGGIVRFVTTTQADVDTNRVDLDFGGGWKISLLHMKREPGAWVSDGSKVAAGQRIGTISRVGATGDHVHVTVWKDGVRVDPFGRRITR